MYLQPAESKSIAHWPKREPGSEYEVNGPKRQFARKLLELFAAEIHVPDLVIWKTAFTMGDRIHRLTMDTHATRCRIVALWNLEFLQTASCLISAVC